MLGFIGERVHWIYRIMINSSTGSTDLLRFSKITYQVFSSLMSDDLHTTQVIEL